MKATTNKTVQLIPGVTVIGYSAGEFYLHRIGKWGNHITEYTDKDMIEEYGLNNDDLDYIVHNLTANQF